MKKVYNMVLTLLSFSSILASPVFYDFSEMGFTDDQILEGVSLDLVTVTSQTGDLFYTSNYGGGLMANSYNGSTSDQYFDFSAPVSDLVITAGDGSGDIDAFAVTVYEYGTGKSLGSFITPLFGGVNEPEWYTLNVGIRNIGRVVFDPANSGVLPGNISGFGGIIITEIGYNSQKADVPEPSFISAMFLSFCSFLFIRKRRE